MKTKKKKRGRPRIAKPEQRVYVRISLKRKVATAIGIAKIKKRCQDLVNNDYDNLPPTLSAKTIGTAWQNLRRGITYKK